MVKFCNTCSTSKSLENFHKSKAQKDGYVSQCKTCKHSYRAKYYGENKCEALAYANKFSKENSEYCKQYAKEYAVKNAEIISIKQKQYRLKNKEKINKQRTFKLKSDPNFKIAHSLRNRIRKVLNIKKFSHVKNLGCTIKELKTHLESKFQPGMSWENYGRYGWHIDHIRPLSKFDLTNPEQFKIACHYTNLQPLWATDNLKKGNK